MTMSSMTNGLYVFESLISSDSLAIPTAVSLNWEYPLELKRQAWASKKIYICTFHIIYSTAKVSKYKRSLTVPQSRPCKEQSRLMNNLHVQVIHQVVVIGTKLIFIQFFPE